MQINEINEIMNQSIHSGKLQLLELYMTTELSVISSPVYLFNCTKGTLYTFIYDKKHVSPENSENRCARELEDDSSDCRTDRWQVSVVCYYSY